MDNRRDKNFIKKKKELFLLCRRSNDLNLKIYYKRHCAVLSKVILTAKKLYYNKIIHGSKNKMKTTWKIINEEKGKTISNIDIQFLIINNNVIMNQNKIANIFNNYFKSIADSQCRQQQTYSNNLMFIGLCIILIVE